jgi:hypothetical protein
LSIVTLTFAWRMSDCTTATSSPHFGKRLAFVFRNFPLSEIHPHAEAAAEVAEFAGTQGRFWKMHDGLFENQVRLGLAVVVAPGSFGFSLESMSSNLASAGWTSCAAASHWRCSVMSSSLTH